MLINQTHSTNELIKQKFLDEENFFALRAEFQTAGKGQRGNSWEAKAGENLLCSILLKNSPVTPSNQFVLTMITSLAIIETIHLPDVVIKWPNDIYHGNKKLAGILIETLLSANTVTHAIIGIGLNVNQLQWSPAIPNPTSLKLITHRHWDIEDLFCKLQQHLQTLTQTFNEIDLKRQYMQHLFRRTGFYKYFIRQDNITPNNPIFASQIRHKINGNAPTEMHNNYPSTPPNNLTQTSPLMSDNKSPLPQEYDIASKIDENSTFLAQIIDIDKTGQLILELPDGTTRTFHFKQIGYVL